MLVGNETLYTDALTLIIQRYATVLPCDSITPIRYGIKGRWMCSTPTIVSCTSPSQLTPTSDDKIHGFVQQLHDFTHGIGSGVFSGMQRYLHKLNMEYGALREPVVQEITALAIHHVATTGKLNSFYSPYDLARLKWEIGGALIPFFSIIGKS